MFHSQLVTGFGRARPLPSLFNPPKLRLGSAGASPSRENETALRIRATVEFTRHHAAANVNSGTCKDNVVAPNAQNELGNSVMHDGRVGYRVTQFRTIHVALTKA
jgi:hypothetical protein